MECIIGVAFKDFVILATDATSVSSIIVQKHNEEKVYKLSDHLMMAVSGASGDTHQFAEFIAKNVQLYKMRNNYELSTAAAAHFTRQNLAQSLRSRSAYNVNMLLAGFDKDAGGELFFLDYLAASIKLNYGAHGYGGMFATSILDRYYRKGILLLSCNLSLLF
ncbi:hypothetical protein QYM36_002125 [Artemia franciscana]|uniref:Proteasome subunit beta n=1 Tax=Artemia franciscana TaxID=6661 RepID=A0AA88IN20_ARTSF|nr:hypothetical protein QYM36_002125 [Artemia franciscana]